MTVKLVGYRNYKFVAKDTGELIEGSEVYYLHDDMEVEGLVAVKKSFNKTKNMPELILGREYELDHNEKGRVCRFLLIPESSQKPEGK